MLQRYHYHEGLWRIAVFGVMIYCLAVCYGIQITQILRMSADFLFAMRMVSSSLRWSLTHPSHRRSER